MNTTEWRCCPKVRELLEVDIELFAAFTRGFDTTGAPVPEFDIALYRYINNLVCDQKKLRAEHEEQCADCIQEATSKVTA
jgi:hypothetical protein